LIPSVRLISSDHGTYDVLVRERGLGGSDFDPSAFGSAYSTADGNHEGASPGMPGILREVEGKPLHVANTPTIGTVDLRALRLEEREGQRTVILEISRDTARRFANVTGANIGSWMVLELNDWRFVPQIATAITGSEFVMAAPGATLADLCRTP